MADTATMLYRQRLLRSMTPQKALQVLGIQRAPHTLSLTASHIKKAYITRTLLCHPDLFPEDPRANDNFKELGEALRVALQAIRQSNRHNPEAPTSSHHQKTAAASSDSECHTSNPFELLRDAILNYQHHRRQDEETLSRIRQSQPNIHAPKERNLNNAPPAEPPHGDFFYTPSLECIQQVCVAEHEAKQHLLQLCKALPIQLSGPGALFDVVAFYPLRYVTLTAKCMQRFAQHLPIIVSRVVRQRAQRKPFHARSPTAAVSAGFGSGDRPLQQTKIEDMGMKPLVLAGALVFALPKPNPSTTAAGDEDSECSSTCDGVERVKDIQVCPSLRCVLYPSDSIGDVVKKMAQWEQESFKRLQLELAVVDVCSLCGSFLGLEEETEAAPKNSRKAPMLMIRPHLEAPSEELMKVVRFMQEMTRELCSLVDDSRQILRQKDLFSRERVEKALLLEQLSYFSSPSTSSSLSSPRPWWWPVDAAYPPSLEDLSSTRTPLLIHLVASCTLLTSLALPYIRGSIALEWPETLDSSSSTHETSASPPPPAAAKTLVSRHAACCIAEDIGFRVNLRLPAASSPSRLYTFLMDWYTAMREVVQQANRSQQCLPEVLDVREKVRQEEFILEEASTSSRSDSSSSTNEASYRYRRPVFLFPRLFNLNTERELQFWKQLYQSREYLAQHAPMMAPCNVYYECPPYDANTAESPPWVRPADSPAGWVTHDASDGCDSVVLSREELDTHEAFQAWLEEVVEQSSLNRQVQRLLSEEGIGYVFRDQCLPLPHFLSFVQVFCRCTAVRAVLEAQWKATGGKEKEAVGEGVNKVLTPAEVGLSITVGMQCDVREGGRLLVAWDMDPNILVSLLSNATEEGKAAELLESSAA